jgi:hypothetical protein
MNHNKTWTRWTPQEIALVIEHYPHRFDPELRALLPGRTNRGIYHQANKHGLRKSPEVLATLKRQASARALESWRTRFAAGHTPWNKGLSYQVPQSIGHRYQVGSLPPTTLPLGTERVKKGIRYRKVTEARYGPASRRWKQVHHLIWEEAHGPVPPGHIVHFLDGDTSNCAIENLACVSRGVLCWIAGHYPERPLNPELVKTLIALAELELAANRGAGGSRKRRKQQVG